MNNDFEGNTPASDDEKPVVVYGTRWCAATQYVRRYLDRKDIPHSFRDLDRDQEAADQVRFWTGGYLSHPTVKIVNDVLVEPLSNEIEAALQKNNLI